MPNVTRDAVYKTKFIAFIDILGFRNLVRSAELENRLDVGAILNWIDQLGPESEMLSIAEYGPDTCPDAPKIRKDIEFQITQMSDSVLASAELSPAGVVNLAAFCYRTTIRLMKLGLLCRGCLLAGNIYHDKYKFFGSGYNAAVEREPHVKAFQEDVHDTGTPFIEVDVNVCDYVRSQSDKCVKEMFDAITHSDGRSTAIFSFRWLDILVDSAGSCEPSEGRERITKILGMLELLQSRLHVSLSCATERGMKKIKHYQNLFADQEAKVRDVGRMIDRLSQPFPNLHYGAIFKEPGKH